MKIEMTSVYVDDQDKALRFYTKLLGFAKKADFSQGPFRWLAVASPEEPDGISRFPCEVFPYVLGVSDRAGLWYTSRYRCTRWYLPHTPTASASRSELLSRLNTRPARSPVNASTPPSRAAPHDSGPMWVATPLSCDFFIHYNLAGLTGAQEPTK